MLLFILFTVPDVLLLTSSALFAEPRVGKVRAWRMQEDVRTAGTAGVFFFLFVLFFAEVFILFWLAQQL